jgi:pimeloyl-ACP methyl ester carboxylesterase
MTGKKIKIPIFSMIVILLAVISIYFWFPGLIYQTGIQALRIYSRTGAHVIMVNDHRWSYLDGGDGESILFIHGFGSDKDSWGPFLRAFSANHRIIVPDLPGFGENSRIPSVSYDIPTQAKRLDRFIEHLGLESFHLAGISMGGYIAAYYASEYPTKVKSLFLMDSAGVDSPVDSLMWKRYNKDNQLVLLYENPEQFDEFLSYVFHTPPKIPRHFKAYLAREGMAEHDFREKILQDMSNRGMSLLETRLHKIDANTLVLWGRDDKIIHVSAAEVFRNGLKHGHILVLDRCGHVPYLEKPKETTRAYQAFLDRVSKSP